MIFSWLELFEFPLTNPSEKLESAIRFLIELCFFMKKRRAMEIHGNSRCVFKLKS